MRFAVYSIYHANTKPNEATHEQNCLRIIFSWGVASRPQGVRVTFSAEEAMTGTRESDQKGLLVSCEFGMSL